MTRAEQNRQAAIATALVPLRGTAAAPADAPGLPTDLAGIVVLLRTMLGQTQVPTGTAWPMSNNHSATRLDALEQSLADFKLLVASKFGDLGPRLDLAQAALAKVQTNDAAQDAQLQWLTAKDKLLESATAANALDIAALQLRQTASEAQQQLLAARLTTDEAAITAAQAKAEAAQAAATAARNVAESALAKAEADAVAAQVAKAAADAAQATATAAQTAYTALAGRFRTVRVSTPAVALAGTMSVAVTWPTPFADANYNAVAELEGLSLIGLTTIVTNRTATGCIVTSKNILGVALAAGAGTLTVTAIHDA